MKYYLIFKMQLKNINDLVVVLYLLVDLHTENDAFTCKRYGAIVKTFYFKKFELIRRSMSLLIWLKFDDLCYRLLSCKYMKTITLLCLAMQWQNTGNSESPTLKVKVKDIDELGYISQN